MNPVMNINARYNKMKMSYRINKGWTDVSVGAILRAPLWVCVATFFLLIISGCPGRDPSSGGTTPLGNPLTVDKAGLGTGTITSDPTGINCGGTCFALFATSTSVTLTATPDSGSIFAGWFGADCVGTGTCTVTMDTVQSVTAIFINTQTANQILLSVTKAGLGTGIITSDPTGINCGTTCFALFQTSTSVTLTATPDSGSIFGGWFGGDCTGTSTCMVTMDTAKSVTAIFINTQTSNQNILTVTKGGLGTGVITSNPTGINCGATGTTGAACFALFAAGTSVTLTAKPNSGSSFAGWSGGGCTGKSTCTVTMNTSKSVTAIFTNTQTSTHVILTVTKDGLGTGTITSNPTGINCGASCFALFAAGTSVTLTATPMVGSVLSGWSDSSCPGTGTCTVKMDANKSVTATFALASASGPFKVTLLGSGPRGIDPLPSTRVILNDPTTGAVVGDKLTDAKGVADFGDIGSPRTTLSIITQRTDGGGNRKNIFTFVDIPTTGIFSNFTDKDEVLSTQAIVNVTMTNLPTGTTQAQVFTGGYNNQGVGFSGSTSTANITGLNVNLLQSDLNFSLLGVAKDSNRMTIGCGSLVDLDPKVVNNTNVTFSANGSPVSIPFTASEPVVPSGYQILRKGVVFDQYEGYGDTTATSGTLKICSIPGAEKFEIGVDTQETQNASSKEISKISSTLPAALTFTLPSLSIDSLSRSTDGRTVSWTKSGADLGKLDLFYMGLEWNSGGVAYNWDLVGDPATATSLTLPTLPTDLSDRPPPTTGVGVFLHLAGLDNVNGWEDVVQKFIQAGGDFDVGVLFNATEFFSVNRTLPVLAVTKAGNGSGKVTSSPAGIDCGATCAANFALGTSVTLTATPAPGSTFNGWSGRCGGTGTCTVTMDDYTSVTATFTQIPTLFPISTISTREGGIGAAYSGINYLVGIQGDYLYGTSSAEIAAQLVLSSGTLDGSLMAIKRTGSLPHVSFDGTNYLMVWEDDAQFPNKEYYGQFIKPGGTLVGAPFIIGGPPIQDQGGIAFGGGNYLVTYFKEVNATTKDSKLYGRIVSPSGVVGSEITISTGFGDHAFQNVAFNGTDFLVIWTDDSNDKNVIGRFVGTDGTLKAEFTIDSSTDPSDNPSSLACDTQTGKCLVVWTDEVGGQGSGEWDLFGRLVSPDGSVGSLITVSTAPGQQFLPTLAFDGTNYLIVWTDMRNDTNKNFACDTGEGTCWDIYGQYVSASGQPVGSNFPINTDAKSQVGAVVFGGGKYLVLVNSVVDGLSELTFGDLHGMFITP